MGKPTGFLEFERKNDNTAAPLERIGNFNEFHSAVSEEERREQGARCMNCGVPFCQSGMILKGMATGCPLHNLIPEWNDAVYHGNARHALSRLLKTNSFPEFTGRVCPALCEAACVCGMEGSSVTVKDNELYIIEEAFRRGYMEPKPPKVRTGKMVAVIGSGPAGLTVADRLNKRGHNVTVFEKSDRPGGLLMYGIPNMKLDKNVIFRRIELMEKEGVEFVLNADIKGKKAKEILAEYDAVVLCTGAPKPRDIAADGRDAAGVYFAVDFLSANTKSLLDSNFADKGYVDVKGKNVVIVGGGDTGNDCVGTSVRHGAKSVTQLEIMPMPPKHRTPENAWPQYPKTLKTDYGQEEAIAVYGHDPRLFETTVKEIVKDKKGHITAVKTAQVAFRDGKFEEKPGTEKQLPCDVLIIAAGFLGTEKYVADAFGLKLTPRSNAETAPGSYATNVEKLFAAGDARRGQSLVVWAIEEGRECSKEVDCFLMQYTDMI